MMGKGTFIQWADDTVNPTSGCDGCELWAHTGGGPCYAGPVHEQRLAKALPHLYGPRFTDVRLVPGRMGKAVAAPDLWGKARPGKPWLDGLPRLIFVGDMGDILSQDVPFPYLESEVVDAAESPAGRRHILLLLTKRPARLRAFAHWLRFERGRTWPANLWGGTSLTGRKSLPRLEGLARAHAAGVATTFVSAEPLRERVELGAHLRGPDAPGLVIVGGESRQAPYQPVPLDVEWVRALLRECREAKVAAFVKQLGSVSFHAQVSRGETLNFRLDLRDSHGGDWSEWPADLRVREFPYDAAARAVGKVVAA